MMCVSVSEELLLLFFEVQPFVGFMVFKIAQ